MSERETLPPEIHPEVLLLPWYANGTLGPEERQQVARHLESCPDCRRELDELAQIKRELTTVYGAQPGPSPQLARSVLTRVAQESSWRPAAVKASGHWLDGVDEWFRSLLQPQWVPTLAALMLVAQFGLLLWVTMPPSPSDQITTRSVARPTATFKVTFQEQATEGQIRALLRSIRGRVIDGPDPGHAYVVQISAEDPALMAKTLEILQGRPEVVLRADPFQP